jgi:hypothetical protein
MAEVVVRIGGIDSGETTRLSQAVDAFAHWSREAGLVGDGGDAPDIMMLTERTGEEVLRRLVFQDREHAARFLMFWRRERRRSS